MMSFHPRLTKARRIRASAIKRLLFIFGSPFSRGFDGFPFLFHLGNVPACEKFFRVFGLDFQYLILEDLSFMSQRSADFPRQKKILICLEHFTSFEMRGGTARPWSQFF